MPVGKRIYLKRELPNLELLKQFRTIPAANVADVMERSCAMNPRIRLLNRPKNKINAGVALTVKARAGDNLALHYALNIAQENDFIVVSNEGDNTRSLLGMVMLCYIHYKKVAGIVIDGPIRDIDEIRNLDFPVYATGSTPGGPYKEGPGEVNVPISCGEISVDPGDIILADPDGVIVIPKKDAEVVLKQALEFQAKDAAKVAGAANGTVDRSWVEKLIKEKGFEIIDDCYRK